MKLFTFVEGALSTNNYLVQQDDECIVIDCSYGDNRIANYINNNYLKLKAVLLTHGHFDHCGGVKRLLDCCGNVPVYVGEQDKSMCLTASGNLWGIECDNCVPTEFYSEGKLLIGGFDFDVLFTPGHTQGGVCLLTDDFMFSGDTLFRGSIGRTDFPDSSFEKMLVSLNKIQQLGKNYTVLTGHGESSSLEYEKKYNPYLNNYDTLH